ncbi:MAG: hypothetical protein ACOC7J_04065 [Armatimonadota bacterium]
MPKPPKNVQERAQRALRARERYEGSDKPATVVGMARANQLAKGEEVSYETLRRMRDFFNRHEKNKDTERGAIAWGLWGGDPGRRWAERELKKREDD